MDVSEMQLAVHATCIPDLANEAAIVAERALKNSGMTHSDPFAELERMVAPTALGPQTPRYVTSNGKLLGAEVSIPDTCPAVTQAVTNKLTLGAKEDVHPIRMKEAAVSKHVNGLVDGVIHMRTLDITHAAYYWGGLPPSTAQAPVDGVSDGSKWGDLSDYGSCLAALKKFERRFWPFWRAVGMLSPPRESFDCEPHENVHWPTEEIRVGILFTFGDLVARRLELSVIFGTMAEGLAEFEMAVDCTCSRSTRLDMTLAIGVAEALVRVCASGVDHTDGLVGVAEAPARVCAGWGGPHLQARGGSGSLGSPMVDHTRGNPTG